MDSSSLRRVPKSVKDTSLCQRILQTIVALIGRMLLLFRILAYAMHCGAYYSSCYCSHAITFSPTVNSAYHTVDHIHTSHIVYQLIFLDFTSIGCVTRRMGCRSPLSLKYIGYLSGPMVTRYPDFQFPCVFPIFLEMSLIFENQINSNQLFA